MNSSALIEVVVAICMLRASVGLAPYFLRDNEDMRDGFLSQRFNRDTPR